MGEQNSRVLIAILTCHKNRHRADAQRRTWIQDIHGADYRFFLGRGDGSPQSDEVWLDCEDDYWNLPDKTKKMCSWALAHRYDFIFKCDDDVLVFPDRLLKSGFEKYDYSGWLSRTFLREDAKAYYDKPRPCAGGFSYWLSAKAARIVSLEEWHVSLDFAEDRFVGNTLAQHGILGHHDDRYHVTNHPMTHNQHWAAAFEEINKPFENMISLCSGDNQYPVEHAYKQYKVWKETGQLPKEVWDFSHTVGNNVAVISSESSVGSLSDEPPECLPL
jgi:hypothetical protein